MTVTLDQRPIFITGSERSGTTLVMAILGCHSQLAVPEVSWYYPRFRPYLHTYGELSAASNLHTLSNEMTYGLRSPFWDMKVNPATFGDEIFRNACDIEKSFAGVFAAMMQRYCQEVDKPRWGEKTPYNLFYIKEILDDFPNAQIVFISRDGRDASAEFLDSSFGPTNIYAAAQLWDMGQRAVEPWRKKLPQDQWYDIKYEAFVRDPVNETKALCDFLDVAYEPTLLEFHTTPIAKRRGKSKDNAPLGHPISDKYIGRYKQELSERDQRIMAWIAGETLKKLGYEDILEPLDLTQAQINYYEEMDGRIRAAQLDGPAGWIVYESYNDWLIDNREMRRTAGLWTTHPSPAPFPIGHPHEEYLSGMRAMRRWKKHFSIKRQFARDNAAL